VIATLPPEIAGLIHPDRLANERAYWAARDGLLAQYTGLWVGYADGRVVASGRSPVAVLAAAEATGLMPHLACVGREGEPDRVRRETFAYDMGYPGEPLPLLRVEFRPVVGGTGVVLDRVIPDTGADVSVLPWADCQAIGLDPSRGQRGQIGGVGGGRVSTLSFLALARLDGQDLPCRLQADFTGRERILGRDVLNQLDVLFRGPAGEVVVGP
jgi:predicted aspartyl protease